jgi:3-oxoacyl-[acyl-carrier-protein] synthase-3
MSHDQVIYIAGTGSSIPDKRESVAAAVESGRAPEGHAGLGYVEIAVAADVPAPQLAIEAARTALERSEVDPADVGLALHASCGFQGIDMWPPAAYIANNAVGPSTYPMDIQQRCLGGIAAMRLAVAWLRNGSTSAALLTTADNFAPPWIDRWNQPTDYIYGDGGTAMVLSTRGGIARIRGSAGGADTAHEGWTRGDTPFTLAPGMESPVRMMDRAIENAARADPYAAFQAYEKVLLRTRDQALAEAEVRLEDIARVVVPNVHRGYEQTENYEVLGFTEKQSLWEFGRYVGHLGAGDHFAGLNWLLEQRELAAGDLVLLIGAGSGFTFGAAVVEILDTPAW